MKHDKGVTIRINGSFLRKFEKMAKKENRSVAGQIRHIMGEWLNDMQKQQK